MTTTARDSFAQTLRAEWTKLRTVRSTGWCLLLLVVLSAALSALLATGGRTNANAGPRYVDRFSFVHRPLTGDGTITARVAGQADSAPWAKAGVIVKRDTEAGAPYAAMLVTPHHGTRMEALFGVQTVAADAPRWLRLTRTDDVVTGFGSTDGATWQRVGAVTIAGLPPTAEVGLFVTSPPREVLKKVVGGVSGNDVQTTSTATFDNVTVEPATAQPPVPWAHLDVVPPPPPRADNPGGPQPAPSIEVIPGTFTENAGTFTVTGSGEIAGYGIASFRSPDDDIVLTSLAGTQIGLMAVVALGVLFATSEYKTRILRTTFTAVPRRGRVLAAKALLIGGAVLIPGVIASVAAFHLAQPNLRARGFAPPAYPIPHLTDPTVARAVLGTGLFLTLLAVFSVGVGTVLRRSARAISLVVGLILVPQIVGVMVPSFAFQQWLTRLTPVAGLAIQQTRHRWDTAIGPWSGLGVLCLYTAAALGAAYWAQRRRDA